MTNYTHLSEKEREFIFLWLKNGLKQYEIAKILNRNPWTISREIKRNKSLIWTYFNNNIEEKNKKENYHYLPDRANNKYKVRKKEAWKKRPILKWWKIFLEVIKRLKELHSPEIISGRLKKEWIWSISHEAIYQFIYNKNYKYLKLWEYLPQKRKKRKQNYWRKSKRNLIPNRIDISTREENINNRSDIWHWEWDSIEWKRWTWCWLHVSVERKTRLTRIRKLERKTALNTSKAMIHIFSNIPKELRKTTTVDNWAEFTSWENTKKELGIEFYFTHPYSSWEKWSVERINGFIRRFFPKWTDFNYITDEEIQFVEDWINNRPMTCLNYKTPNEFYNSEVLKIT